MEDRSESSYGILIPKKSRTLDLKSLYKTKETKETLNKNLKRKGITPRVDDEKRNKKRKKSRKEVSLRSLENADSGCKKIVDEECQVAPGSGKQDFCELKLGLNQRLCGRSDLNGVSLSLDDDAVHIPKRKRGFVGRKKFAVGKGPLVVGQNDCKSGHGDQITNPSTDDLDRRTESPPIRKNRDFDESKENMSSDLNLVKHFKENEDPACLSFVNNGDDSSKKSRREQGVLVLDNTSLSKQADASISSSNISDELQEDGEENLEENAARMLSSRFDSSCTGFSSGSKSSTLQAVNGLPFLLSFDQNHVCRRLKSLSGAELASVDTASRVLRPRNQHKEKGNSRKRRHFYEIFLGDLDAYWVLNRRIKVFWPLDQSWYYGLINDYDKEKMLHHIKYDDRDEEWIDLQTERFKLLLLPSEVPRKVAGKRGVMRSKRSDEQRRSKPRQARPRELIPQNDSYDENCMDSEPIISWLARTSRRVKSSFHGIKKQKTSGTVLNSASTSYEEPAGVQGCLTKSSWGDDSSNLSSNSRLQDKLGTRYSENSSLLRAACPKVGKTPIVYFRRRFRRSTQISPPTEGKHLTVSAPRSSYFNPVFGRAGEVKEPDDRSFEIDGPWQFTYNAGVLKICFLDVESAAFRFDLNFTVHLVINSSSELQNRQLLHSALLLHYGSLMMKWPRVHLEMLFVDNVVGLRLLLFEGCLKMAASFVFLVLRVFHQPADQGMYFDLQLPVTSIRFKFSCLYDSKKQLVFAFYNFSRVKNSKWMYLDSKLKSRCLLSKQLHISECTYDNVQALQNGSSQFSITSAGKSSSFKAMQKRTMQGINIMGISKESTKVRTNHYFDSANQKLPPFALSFTAAPTFFLSLHLQLLMERSVAHISFCDHMPPTDQESSDLMTDGCSSLDDCSNWNSDINLKQNMKVLSNDDSFAEPEGVIGSSVCSDGVLPQSSQNIALSSAGTSSSYVSERLSTIHLSEEKSHNLRSEHCPLPPSSLIGEDKVGDVSHSFVGGHSIHISSVDHIDKSMECDLHDAQHSSDLSWNINGGFIPSPNPTAPRSSWHRNRNSSSSFGLPSHGWSDGKAGTRHNGFSNGPKKPRTQVSYSLPFHGDDFSSRHKSHNQKGFPHKRIRKANEKKLSDVAGSLEKNFDSLYCDANVLITLGEKGWREYGAQVVLELFDHNEWKLSVKLSGITRYSYKAHQFLQPGSTNRYTHAMMWKGGKDWVLEFTDRSQWALFKEMHQECYNRNIRAASVKNIPIPGVRCIKENDENGTEVAFVHSSKYFHQVETDVEMALDPSHVLYDMDSEDEKWLFDIRNSKIDNSECEGISDEIFEKNMDILEKAAYAQQRVEFSPNEVEELMPDIRPLCVVHAIYEHWQQRRKKKGMALIRHFQPPMWERYRHQLKEWEVAITKNKIPNGCLDKAATLEKPSMFAFCLKPRGLEVMNKGSKHRSQKKFSVSGHTHNFLADQDSFRTYGRSLNGFAFGDEKFTYPGYNYDSLDDSPLPQTSPRVFSPRGAGSLAYYATGRDGFDRNNVPKFHHNKSKKFGSFMYHNDSQMMASFNQRMSGKRNGVHRLNMGYYDSTNHREYLLDGPYGHEIEQLDGSDLEEFRLHDPSGAVQHAHNMAKLKRERAQRLLHRADLAIHKAVVALMTAEAMKASECSNSDE